MSRKPRKEPRFFPPPAAFVPETPEEAQAYEEHIRGMFDTDEIVYRSTAADKPETVHYGQREVAAPPIPRRRRDFEEILTDEELERIMPSWEQQFLPDWKERAAVRARAAIEAHNARAQREGGPIFHVETSEEIFPDELAAAQRYQAQVDRYEAERGAWALLAIAPGVIFFVCLFGGLLLEAFANIRLPDVPYGVSMFLVALGVACFVVGLIGAFATMYKYRHLDPTAGDPIREALKGAAVNVAGGIATAYVAHKLKDRDS